MTGWLLFFLKGNFGLFGVIYDITLEVDPLVTVETQNIFDKTVETVFFDQKFLEDLIADNMSVEIFWYPFSGWVANWPERQYETLFVLLDFLIWRQLSTKEYIFVSECRRVRLLRRYFKLRLTMVNGITYWTRPGYVSSTLRRKQVSTSSVLWTNSETVMNKQGRKTHAYNWLPLSEKTTWICIQRSFLIFHEQFSTLLYQSTKSAHQDTLYIFQFSGKVAPPSYYKWENFIAWRDKVLFDIIEKPLQLGENERLTPTFMKAQYQFVSDQFEPLVVQQLPHAVHYRYTL